MNVIEPTEDEIEDALFKLRLLFPQTPRHVAVNLALVRKNLGEIAARDALEAWQLKQQGGS